ncbi:MAG: M1 family metallopeptidase [Acidimicrobiales bacterium]
MPSAHDSAGQHAPDEAHRLPRTVTPSRYRLRIDVDLDQARFTGTAEIALSIETEISEIVLNAAELEIGDAKVELGAETLEATVALDEASERAVFTLERPLQAGHGVLHCSFKGVLNDKLRGLYRSTFVDNEGNTRTIATSQMESTDARRAFPCFDEPDRKAVFEITLVIDPDMVAYSNAPVVAESVAGGRKVLQFAPTMVMSSYLVALIVGPLVATEPRDVDGVPVRVVHVPGKAHLSGFALDVAEHALRFFSEYFAIPYPAEKLDLVAIPDFAFGAMENLGCVTFRETALLADEKVAARADLERVADVVSHEIAHMWFGDLVTMRWWEGIWLNEAFATFMEVLCVDAFRPSWERWVSFGLEREAALAVDGLHSTRPIEYPVGSPEEADGMFDVLTYQKGGSVLRMLEQYLGAETFRDGVRRYLSTHSYANTVTGDLWDALESVSGQPVRSVMDSWILQGGHPVVSVEESGLAQAPFSYQRHGAHGAHSAIGERWSVPVLVRPLGGGEAQALLLEAPSGALPAIAPPAVLNAGGWGVYRVSYGERLGELAANLSSLTPLERANLFNDAWAMVLSGRAPLSSFLDLAAQLGQDTEPATFATVAGALALVERAANEDAREDLAAATRALLGARFASLGWEPRSGEGERIPNLRSVLLSTLGTIGKDEAIRAEAARRFDAARNGGEPVNADLEGAVLGVLADQRRPGDYDAFYARYQSAGTPQQEQRYLSALAAFPDVELGTHTFELALHDVRTQDAPYLITGLLANRVAGPAVFERLTDHFDEVLDRFPVNSHSRMLQGVRTMCGDAAVARRVTEFLSARPLRSGQRSVDQALERLWVNVDFVERERHGLSASLGHLSGASGS